MIERARLVGAISGADVLAPSLGYGAKEFVYELTTAHGVFHLKLWEDEDFLLQAQLFPLSECCGEELARGLQCAVCSACFSRKPLARTAAYFSVLDPTDADLGTRTPTEEALQRGLEEWLSYSSSNALQAVLDASLLSEQLLDLVFSYESYCGALGDREDFSTYFKSWRPHD